MVRNWTLALARKQLATSVPFHTVLCNRRGRKGIELPPATRLGVNINTFPCLSFIGFGVIAGSVCTLLDAQGRVGAWLLGTHRAQGGCQETEEEFRCGSGNRRVGQQDEEGGEGPISLIGEAPAVSSHTEGGIFIIPSVPLAKSLLVSTPRKSLQTLRSSS